MKREVKLDPFFSDQPPMKFVEELKKPLHSEKIEGFGTKGPGKGEVDASGAYLECHFDDPKGLLETSYADFYKFLTVNGAEGSRFPIVTEYTQTPVFEAWRVVIDSNAVHVQAADTEGIRRALVWLEGEMSARGGAILPVGITQKEPRMHTRITRCFFSPINRPPKYGDELSDGIDYYPDEYLNRLMHDGANAVWIYTRFSDLVYSSYLPDYGKGSEARIAKLNRVCEKCARYGIKPYVFAIEPVALPDEQMKLIGADGGTGWNGKRLFCVNHENGFKFVEELGKKLFESCPGLGGFISITYGERPTSCVSAYTNVPDIDLFTPIQCPRCQNLSAGQALANAARALASGIHKANPDAKVVSWSYGHRLWPNDDVRDYVDKAPQDVYLCQNFEEMGYAEQLGKTRQGVDYWLSYAGPSQLFEATGDEAVKKGKHMFMKTQTCCSHEVATVPYVPVPGILFKKYKNAFKYNVEGVMQCWYFGNYPSMMSRAAGELAFMHDFGNKRAFLERLASFYWGNENAKTIADSWEEFEKGYTQYPLNIMFSYYGPMHDGPVWQLALKPKNFSLPRTWQTLDPIDGDRIGECLLSGHTLDEAIMLCSSMSEHWHKGLALMETVPAHTETRREQLSVAKALDILFASGTSILKFYSLREKLGRGEGEALATLGEMRTIVLEEIARSRALFALCEKDSRLGYHSEGEGYKYFPKKLEMRVEQMEKLLDTEFREVEQRIKDGLAPLEYYEGVEPGSKAYLMKRGDISQCMWEGIEDAAAFRAAYDDTHVSFEFKLGDAAKLTVDPEFRLFWPQPTVEISKGGHVAVPSTSYLYYSIFGSRVEKLKDAWHGTQTASGTLLITLDRSQVDWQKTAPFKMRFDVDGALWCREENPIRTLGKNNVSPGDFGWIIPEECI